MVEIYSQMCILFSLEHARVAFCLELPQTMNNWLFLPEYGVARGLWGSI